MKTPIPLKVSALSPLEISEEPLCFHCHLPLEGAKGFRHDDKAFCCNGCLSVFKILHANGLEEFYKLGQVQEKGRRLTQYDRNLEFHHFDKGSETLKTFYLEGVHCLACLWLIESSPDFVEGLEELRLNMSNSLATVRISEKGSFSSVARWLNKLGYSPHLIVDSVDAAQLFKDENHESLKRIGVAGFCAGNIMLLAISIYGGAEGRFFQIFTWLSALLYLPALLYSAQPFFAAAWNRVKQRKLSLDIPVSVILVLGSIVSYANAFLGSEHFYFDSLSVFIFLLLSARYFLKRIQQKHAATQKVQDIFDSTQCLRRESDGSFRVVSAEGLLLSDVILLKQGETLPRDCRIISGAGHINTAFVSGEHLPKRVGVGESVLAGSVVVSGDLLCQVSATLEESQLGKILQSIESSWHRGGCEVDLADRLASLLLGLAFLLSASVLIYFGLHANFSEGMRRAMAILIVTCPCALGLGTPLAYIQGLKDLFQKRIVVKNGSALQRIFHVKRVYFDKTGTLTTGELSVGGSSHVIDDFVASRIWNLEHVSIHPIAQSLCRYLEKNYVIKPLAAPENFSEELGKGVSATIDDQKWRAVKSRESHYDVDVFRDEELVVSFRLADQLQSESQKTIRWMKDRGIESFLLSGDKQENVSQVARDLGLLREEAIGDLLPEAKAEHMRSSSVETMMVGDGFNDVLAFDEASVGVAIGQKVDLKLKNADVFIPSAKIEDLMLLFEGAYQTRIILRRNLVLSVIYNIVGIGGSLLGWINPLTAAVLMPLSSLSVVLSTLWRKK